MQQKTKIRSRVIEIAVCMLTGITVMLSIRATNSEESQGLQIIGEYPAPGIESELSGIYPHPSDDTLYLVVANKNPAYTMVQQPKLKESHRGRLLTVHRNTGKVVRAIELVGGDYGGMAFARGHLFISSLYPPEILEVDLDSGTIVNRIPLESPAGGLAYDQDQGVLVAQLFVRAPGLAVIDIDSGATIRMLWSDESAMGLAKIGSIWLCTWSSGFDSHAFGELRRINSSSGRVTGRVRFDDVHFAIAPTVGKGGSAEEMKGFMSMRALDRATGEVTIVYYGINEDKIAWVH